MAHPDVVKKLGIIDFVFPGSPPNKNTVEPWWVGFHKIQDLPESLVSGNERKYLSWFYRQLAYNPYSITEQDIDEYVRQYSAPGGMRAGFEYFRAFPSDVVQNSQALNSPPDVPALAVSGEFSGVGMEETEDNPTMESMRRLAKNVTGVLMPSSGHWIPEEQPRLLAELLVSFFKENDIQSQSDNDTKSLIYSDIKDLMHKIDNATLSPASDEPQARNLSDALVGNQNRSVTSENFSGIQERIQQQQTAPHLSVNSDNKTSDKLLNQFGISRGQELNVTVVEKQKSSLLANQTNTTKNIMEGEIIATNLTANSMTDRQQISDDSTSGEQLAEQETLSSAAIDAIGRIIGARESE
ncbi:MAG: alpha/beta fold hydrolase [Nitrososphaeraceae archaeon]